MDLNVIEQPVVLEANGTRIPAVFSLPKEATPAWVVIIVPGSFATDIDGNFRPEHGNPFSASPHAYKDLSQQLAADGCAALRYARGGVTVVDKAVADAHKHFADRTAVIAACVRAARARIPGVRVALAGHSEGGPAALLFTSLYPELKVDAYISLSAPGRRFFDIMLQQTEESAKAGVPAFGGMKVDLDASREAIAYIRRSEPVPAAILKRLPPFGVHAMDEKAKQYLREYDAVDPLKLVAALRCPVLLVQGGEDTSVYPDNAGLLASARAGNPAVTEKALFPGLQHFYKKVPPGIDPMAAFNLETDCDPAVAAAIAAWLVKLSSGATGK